MVLGAKEAMTGNACHRLSRTGSSPDLWGELDPLAGLGIIHRGNNGFLALDLDPRDFRLPFVAALRFLALKKAHRGTTSFLVKVEARASLRSGALLKR